MASGQKSWLILVVRQESLGCVVGMRTERMRDPRVSVPGPQTSVRRGRLHANATLYRLRRLVDESAILFGFEN